MNPKFYADYLAETGEQWNFLRGTLRILVKHNLRYIYFGRQLESARNPLYRKILRRYISYQSQKRGIEIDFEQGNIAGGFQMVHPYNITINPRTVFGERVCVFKGVTTGSIRSGKREGVPVFGNRVVLCPGAFVAGGITVGDDVLIAANAFVDFDVPSHSIVFGNPGVIKHKENATSDYIF